MNKYRISAILSLTGTVLILAITLSFAEKAKSPVFPILAWVIGLATLGLQIYTFLPILEGRPRDYIKS